jgi:hypothetical protein
MVEGAGEGAPMRPDQPFLVAQFVERRGGAF